MKKISIILAIALLAPIAIVKAETTEGATISPTTQKPLIMKMEDRVKKVEEKAEVKKAKIDEKASSTKERIENKAEKIEKKIEVRKEANKVKALELAKRAERKITAAIDRIEILANRVAERLNILAGKGVVKAETKTQVELKLAEAINFLTEAKTFAVRITEEANTSIASSTPKEAFKSTKEVAKEAEDRIKEAHAKVVEAVTMIKASTEEKTKNATTTEQ